MIDLAQASLRMNGLGFGTADAADCELQTLHPAEIAAIGEASARRQRDYCAGRAAGHRALAALGASDGPIVKAGRGVPRFPDGVVGSLSHSKGVAVALAATSDRCSSVGIDIELDPLPEEAAHLVLGESERGWFDRGVRSVAEAFSAKEAAFKALDPLLPEGAPPFRQMQLQPADEGFFLRLPRFVMFISVRRLAHGVLAWTTLPADRETRCRRA